EPVQIVLSPMFLEEAERHVSDVPNRDEHLGGSKLIEDPEMLFAEYFLQSPMAPAKALSHQTGEASGGAFFALVPLLVRGGHAEIAQLNPEQPRVLRTQKKRLQKHKPIGRSGEPVAQHRATRPAYRRNVEIGRIDAVGKELLSHWQPRQVTPVRPG